jgi:gas vesicle protein
MENSNDTGKVILSLLVGALAGAAVGILFAPYKGSKTRKRLLGGAQGLADDVKQRVKDEINALRAKATELELLAEDKMQDVVNGIQKKVDTVKHSA